ncbi:N-acetylmuramic acid 6-phosphate etherase [Actinomadura sp. KC345]|uniref:N-acetylmuramic acid 6-phosphate etherase n=1 Tax=Actinomadura sp. KC345 TaxID=2530371 RepID=UPI0010430C25|nr:N-acetylmuramic acid 6-phosphate etherase [Actinomadura sp. KC345]TDC54649.1 N-acetylmuramic acid 6-phosphate etherase [Actinomadura sp. KC345]
MIDCELPTEGRNPRTLDVDMLPTLEVLRLINSEDATVPMVVASVLPEVAMLVDLSVDSLRGGGRVHYFGAGTSGRLAVIDAAELPPTFGIWGRVVAHHAGGPGALSQAISDVEDDTELGRRDAHDVQPGDVAIGIAASGRTPYVVGALRAAAAVGARTALISCNPHTPYGDEVEVHIGLATGPEVISGSTRMKAGTATKLVLNSFSTTLMIRMGRTYSNLMVSVNALNSKLRARLVRILTEATGMDACTCENALNEAGGNTRVALVSLLGEVPAATATTVLEETDGGVREALQRLRSA